MSYDHVSWCHMFRHLLEIFDENTKNPPKRESIIQYLGTQIEGNFIQSANPLYNVSRSQDRRDGRQDSIRIIQTWLDLTYSDIIHAKITKNKKKFLPFFPFNGCAGPQVEAKSITLKKSLH